MCAYPGWPTGRPYQIGQHLHPLSGRRGDLSATPTKGGGPKASNNHKQAGGLQGSTETWENSPKQGAKKLATSAACPNAVTEAQKPSGFRPTRQAGDARQQGTDKDAANIASGFRSTSVQQSADASVPAVASGFRPTCTSGGGKGKHNRTLVQACCERINFLSTPTEHTLRCRFVNITVDEDFTTSDGIQLAIEGLKGPRDALWFAPPCTGESSWQRLNIVRHPT